MQKQTFGESQRGPSGAVRLALMGLRRLPPFAFWATLGYMSRLARAQTLSALSEPLLKTVLTLLGRKLDKVGRAQVHSSLAHVDLWFGVP